MAVVSTCVRNLLLTIQSKSWRVGSLCLHCFDSIKMARWFFGLLGIVAVVYVGFIVVVVVSGLACVVGK